MAPTARKTIALSFLLLLRGHSLIVFAHFLVGLREVLTAEKAVAGARHTLEDRDPASGRKALWQVASDHTLLEDHDRKRETKHDSA